MYDLKSISLHDGYGNAYLVEELERYTCTVGRLTKSALFVGQQRGLRSVFNSMLRFLFFSSWVCGGGG
jgi:hypothetical protein